MQGVPSPPPIIITIIAPTPTPSTLPPTTVPLTNVLPTTVPPTAVLPTTALPSIARPLTTLPSTARPSTPHPLTARPSTAHPLIVLPSIAHPTAVPRTNAPSTTAHHTIVHLRTVGTPVFAWAPEISSTCWTRKRYCTPHPKDTLILMDFLAQVGNQKKIRMLLNPYQVFFTRYHSKRRIFPFFDWSHCIVTWYK